MSMKFVVYPKFSKCSIARRMRFKRIGKIGRLVNRLVFTLPIVK